MKLRRMIEMDDTGSYMVGDKISFALNDGEEVEALAVKQKCDGMVFYFVDALEKEYQMNFTDTNRGGYKASALRKKLNGEILDRFPDEIRENMVRFKGGDLLRLATECEIFGENYFGKQEDENVQQWEPMKDLRQRLAFIGHKSGRRGQFWLQNKRHNYSCAFCSVYEPDFGGFTYATSFCGV